MMPFPRTCYFCQNLLYSPFCIQHPGYDVNCFDNDITFTLTQPDGRYMFQLLPQNKKLIIHFYTDAIYNYISIYQGYLPPDLTPENSNKFLAKILSMKAFL